jgi:hypothetical protein
MKCLLCSTEIDEARTFPPIEGPGGRLIEDVTGRLKLARDLEKWTCVTIMAQIPGGCRTIRSGHVCPAHPLGDLTLTCVAKSEKPVEKGQKPEGKS